MLKTLFNMIFGRRVGREHQATRKAILYTRNGCCLCDVADQTLRQAGYQVQPVDIDRDPELRTRFDREVPVVEIDGKIRFRGKVDPTLLSRLRPPDASER
ncbi:MAG: glutaredoxin family protein [Pirellulales bacterium]